MKPYSSCARDPAAQAVVNVRPLAGRGIVVTRPRHQAQHLARSIERAGGRAILFPLIDIAPIAETAALAAIVERLSCYDVAIFVSPNAVDQGLRIVSGGLPENTTVLAVGRATARRLHSAGV